MLPDTIPTLDHPPIVLRAFEDHDVPLVRSVATDPLIPLITTVPTSGTEEDALAYVQRQHDRLRSGAGYSFAITEAATGQAVGQIGLWLADLAHGRASTGYWLAPQFRRRGYGRAALQALTNWALDFGEICRIELYVEPWNEGSWRAAESCGFEREGVLRSWQQVGRERKDMYMYSRIALGAGPLRQGPPSSP